MIFDLSVPLHRNGTPKNALKSSTDIFRKDSNAPTFFLTATQFIKKQMVDHLHIPQEKSSSRPSRATKTSSARKTRPRKFAQTEIAPGRYFLFVGGVEPRKNLMALLKAYAMLPPPVQSQAGLVSADRLAG